ncbi:MAG TPA: N-acetylglucosamine-6-phosphate deacetylase [Euzebyales bacterium]
MAGDVEVDDGRIAAVGRAPAGREGLAVPGLIDLHVHGCGGVDFLTADGDAWDRGRRYLLAAGVTAFRPALMTAPPGMMIAALGRLASLRGESPRMLGAHLEGPFLAPNRLGAHDPRHRRDPDIALLERLLAAGPVGEVTLAPELPGALDLVELLTGRGVTVSVGHTDATAAQARAAFDAGARSVTHLCNAMRPLHHRDPGVVAAALTAGAVTVELVVDGHHLDDDMVRVIWRCAGDRVALVTDGTAAAGMTDGTYRTGGIVLTVEDGVVRNPRGALAGSALTMIDAVRNLHALGVDRAAAVMAATRVPADLAGRPDLGRLHPGAAADVVVLDDRFAVRETFVAGARVHAR